MAVELLIPGVKAPVPPPPSYLVLAMAFGVGAGATLGDKSRYRSHGAITGAAWAAGLHGYCLDFESGDPDYVIVPGAHAQLDLTTQDFSFIYRINHESLAAHQMIIMRGVDGVSGYRIWHRDDGRIYFNTWNGAGEQTTTSAIGDIVAGNWYTVGFSRVGAAVRIYLNGVDVTAAPGVHVNPVSNAQDMHIGISAPPFALPLDGRMEFLRIFRGRALVTSEHRAWHRALA